MKRYIMLVGGNMVNKGAEAMTFLAISELKKRFPNHETVLMSTKDYHLPDAVKDEYAFMIEDMNIACWCQRRPLEFAALAILKRLKPATLKRFNEILNNTDIVVDISGYCLSSSFGALESLLGLYRIDTFKRKKIPYYILPQSFGPFDYTFPFKHFMKWKIKRTLQYPKNICAREEDGYRLLTEELGLENVRLTKDMVLTGGTVDYGCIFTDKHVVKDFEIRENSVGLLPNHRAFEANKENDLLDIYRRCIDTLLGQNKNIDILAHSSDDKRVCDQIKSMYADNVGVRVINESLDSVEFSNIVPKYDFFIASRYHSIVHAYKKAVPCLVFGWAVKYADLTNDFSQGSYCFDVRKKIDVSEVEKQLENLAKNFKEDSECINAIHGRMQETDIFDDLKME